MAEIGFLIPRLREVEAERDRLRERCGELEDRLRLACEPCGECGHVDWRELDDILASGPVSERSNDGD